MAGSCSELGVASNARRAAPSQIALAWQRLSIGLRHAARRCHSRPSVHRTPWFGWWSTAPEQSCTPSAMTFGKWSCRASVDRMRRVTGAFVGGAMRQKRTVIEIAGSTPLWDGLPFNFEASTLDRHMIELRPNSQRRSPLGKPRPQPRTKGAISDVIGVVLHHQ
jgi:hypothetical protein